MSSPSRREENRIDLATEIPLKCPMLVHIDPSDLCNLKCKFCFHQFNRKSKGLMSINTYKKIIDGLAETGRPKVINLYKAGEPLLNPEIHKMVKLAKKTADKVWIKTNGILLTRDLAMKLADVGLDVLTVSIIAPNDEKYESISGRKINYKELLENIVRCYRIMRGQIWLHVKIADAGFSNEELNKFIQDFSGVCDDVEVEYLHQPSSLEDNYDFTLGSKVQHGTHGEPLIEKIVCPFVFYSINFERDGRVTVCSNDHKGDTEMGNVNKNTVREIWDGEYFNNFRKLHLHGNRQYNRACKNCEYIKMLPDNIDNARMEILKRYGAN